jgi:hypothetical protein
LTAAYIGLELKFGKKDDITKSAFAESTNGTSEIVWKDIDDKVVKKTTNASEVDTLS